MTMGRYAVIEDAIYPFPPRHRATCHNVCRWDFEAPDRAEAIGRAAAHVEETGHTVTVTAIDVDWIVAVPALPKYEARRIVAMSDQRDRPDEAGKQV